MTVRHGNMVVGTTATGKTTVSEVLAEALTKLHKDGHGDTDPWYQPINIKTLNPKAVLMGELYGEVNPFTNEWTAGIVPNLVNEAVEALENPEIAHHKRWIMFDGPVDTLWIESMNTVLDDSKMLCLNNGQRIRMPDTCTMVFEVNDLKVASPATVSRCGMVFLEPVHLGWKPLVHTWIEQMADVIEENRLPKVKEILMGFLEKLLPIVRKQKEVIPSVDSNLVASCLKLIQIFLNKDAIKLNDPEKIENADKVIATYVSFAVIWSVGANLHDSSRVLFSTYLRNEIHQHLPEFPEQDAVYDYGVDPLTHKFESWNKTVPDFVYNPEGSFFDILVPTSDTVKYSKLLETLVLNGNNVLFMGETGVGKSVIIKDYLLTRAPENLISAFINFSGKTSTKNLSDAIEGSLVAVRKDLLQPKAGKKMCFFVDDVNMPQYDLFGSQPPCELLRQTIDKGGYYDTKALRFKKVRNANFVSACAPPAGGRNAVTPRLFRHFNMIWIPSLSTASMRTIFTSILRGYLSLKPESGLSIVADQVIKALVEIYQLAEEKFLPTPLKSHYTFNLRDMSKVVQGMLMCHNDQIEDKQYLVELFMCETFRVFRDRLIVSEDRKAFSEMAHEKMERCCTMDFDLAAYENIIFGDFEHPDKMYVKLSASADLIPRLNE
jgi:dynein heavy chain